MCHVSVGHVARAVEEAGIPTEGLRSKSVDEYVGRTFDYVITVCSHAHETCPALPGRTQVVHVGFEDPPRLALEAVSEEEALGHYRRVRDEIRRFVATLPGALDDAGPA